jgi:hypothetical protein
MGGARSRALGKGGPHERMTERTACSGSVFCSRMPQIETTGKLVFKVEVEVKVEHAYVDAAELSARALCQPMLILSVPFNPSGP